MQNNRKSTYPLLKQLPSMEESRDKRPKVCFCIFSMKAVGNNIGYYENVIIFSQSPIIANYTHTLYRANQRIASVILHFEYLAQFIWQGTWRSEQNNNKLIILYMVYYN